MMLLAFLAQATVAPPPVAPTAPAPAPPADLAQLAPLPWKTPPRYDPAMTRYVIDEVKAGRCTAETGTGGSVLKVEVSVLVSPGGEVRAIVPRAIGCPTVEQYTSGLISRVARDNVEPGQNSADTWYRSSVTFSWAQ